MSTAAKKKAIARNYARKRNVNRMPLYRPVVTGYGAYKYKKQAAPRQRNYLPSNLGSSLGGLAGTALAGPLGGIAGSALGHGAQMLLKHITGFGDYQIGVNSLMGGSYNPPELINKSKDAVCVRHREYLGDITATSSFALQSYDINPGLSTTFPWLAGVADNFEEYMITGMIFEYKTLSADYTTASSAALGYVIMATQYNVLNADFVDKIHMENYQFANSAKPSESFIHPIECKKSLNPVSELFVRTGSIPAGADQRLYDLGKFQIATGGNSGSGVLGELWCTYEICFYKQKIVDNDDDNVVAHLKLQSINNSSPLGTGTAVVGTGSNLELDVSDGGTIIFPATLSSGQFLVTIGWVGSTTSSTACPSLTALSNCSFPNLFVEDTLPKIYSDSGKTQSSLQMMFVVNITGPSARVVFGDDGVLPAPTSSGDLWVVATNGIITT